MGQIRVLSPGLVNRIAAGECVERPSSVVKELVENALDAGATRIDVSLTEGGRETIRVVDDGAGMDLEDLRLSITPHATSKIETDDDLFNIHTMGFRGEALPSIGAVARLHVTSRRRNDEVAHELRVEGGQAREPVPCHAPPGTTVEVRDLFYCVPARRKFLRTNQTEMGHVTEQFARIALAHPAVAFSLRHQERVTHRLEATHERCRRIADFYGAELADVLLPIERDGGGIRVEGFAAPPAHCRRSAKWEYVFVNGRYVRDRFIGHAIKAAYRSLIKPDEYPVVFLFLTVDPAQVDVNVHPTKTEVRWRDSNYVHAQVLAALRDRFLSTNLDRTLQTRAPDEDEYRQRVRQAMVDFFTKAQTASPDARPTDAMRAAPSHATMPPSTPGAQRPVSGAPEEQAAPRATDADAEETALAGLPSAPSSRLEADEHAGRSRALQIHNTYLVVETDDGMMIIDQHALHERILYEELRERFAEKPLESQRLLLPEVVRVPADRLEALEAHADLLGHLGLSLAPAGPQAVAVHAFPVLLDRVNPAEFVRDLLDLLSEDGQRPNTEAVVHDCLDMMACKAAVKAGDSLSAAEIEALLARRNVAERASHCPHGRPTTLHLTSRDLERQFKRR